MPSPFGQFKEQQVQPINILPYTAGIAESLQKGIAGLGAGIGEAIQGYRNAQSERETVAQMGAYEISKYTYPEMDTVSEDTGITGNGEALQRPTGKVLIRETAPAHIVNLFKKAQKSAGEGKDWTTGLANLDSSELKAFYQYNNQFKKDEETQFNRTIQGKTLALKEKEVDSQIAVQKMALAKQERENRIADQIASVNAQAVADSFTIDKVTEQDNGVAFKVRTPWAKNDPRWKDQPQGDEGPLATGYDEKTILSKDIDSGLKAFGIKKEDISKEPVVEGTNLVGNELAKIIAGVDPKKGMTVDTKELDASKNTTTNKAKFIGEVAEALMVAHPELKEAYNQAFFTDKNNVVNRTPVMSTRAWKVALQSFNSDPAVQAYLSQKYKVSKDGLVAQSVANNGMRIVDERNLGKTTIRTPETYSVPPVQLLKNKYAKYAEIMRQTGKPLEITENDFMLSQGINLNIMTPMVNEQGQIIGYTNSNGTNVISKTEYNNLNNTSANNKEPKNQTQTEYQGANNWLRQYVPKQDAQGKLTGGVEVGNSIIYFPAKDPNNPMADSKFTDIPRGQKEWQTAQQDLEAIDRICDDLEALWKEGSFIDRKLDPFGWSDWQKRYDSKAGELEGRYKKYFIGTGTETEPDYVRLAKRTARPSLMMSPEVALLTLKDTRVAIKSQATGLIKNYGGYIIDKATGKEISTTFTPVSEAWKGFKPSPVVEEAMAKEAEKRGR
jgi:hypothetical protein